METNIGQKNLKLVKKCFHKGHPFSKIFNKNTIKVTYSCLSNMGARIAGQNKQKISSDVEIVSTKKCTCRKTICPVNGECKTMNTIYEAVITDISSNKFKYIGKSATEFNKRVRNHRKDIKIKNIEKM